MRDKEIEKLIFQEGIRQLETIDLIASENYVSEDVMKAMGSILTNKYAEGYPDHRYYGGCQVIDKIESLAIDRARNLFNCAYANVQPHSGSQANRAVIEAVCNPNDTILSLDLNCGGHLTHGSKVSFSGKYYHIVSYHTNAQGYIDYDEMERLAETYPPKLIIAGASAYSREWDYERLRSIANKFDAVLMFDMAHTAGLIAAGLLKNPCNYCDIVTSTTHKTLRGPRGGLILMKKDFDYLGRSMAKLINSSVFPGNQGGPLEHIIAAKAVCFWEAMQPDFVAYQKQVIANAQELADTLKFMGYTIVSGGTDNHEFLVDLRLRFPKMTGRQAEMALQEHNIIVNKNMVPNDTRKPYETSGLRLGTPAITTKGKTENDMVTIAMSIDDILSEYYKTL